MFTLILIIPTSAFGYPLPNGDFAKVASLQTADYFIIPSTPEEKTITVDVAFENLGPGLWHGMIWSYISLPYPDDKEKSFVTIIQN